MTHVLVPGAGGDSWYWHRLIPLLEQRGEPVIAVDLPAGDETAGLAEYADAIVAAAAGATDITVVAHSMGGVSAPLVCGRLDVRRIVLVNAMIPLPGETAGDWWANTGQHAAWAANETAQGRDPDAEFDVAAGFFHDVPDDVRAEAFERDSQQADKPFAEPWPLTQWPDVPTFGIAGADDRLFPVHFQQQVARERLGLALDVVPGGHLLALANPAGLAAALDNVGWRSHQG